MQEKENKTPEERLKKFKSNFIEDLAAEGEWRSDKKSYGEFYDGDQLSSDEKQALKERGQPEVVINRIKPKLDSIFGIEQALKVDTKAFPSGNRESEAELISEELRRTEDGSNFDEEESLAFEDICIDGRAFYKISKEWDGLDGLDVVKHVSNEDIVLDKYTRREDLRTGELKTSKRIHENVWMDLEDAQETFPQFKKELDDSITNPGLGSSLVSEKLAEFNPDQYKQPGGDVSVSDPDLYQYNQFVDKKRKRLRLVTTYYRKPIVKKFIKHSGGTVDVTDLDPKEMDKILNEFEGATSWTETRYSLNTCTFCWGAILEEKKDLRPYDTKGKFPIVLVPGYVTRDEKKKHYGLVKQQMDPQKEVNKRRSKMLHLLNVNQVWYEDGAFPEEAKAFKEMAKPDGRIKYRKDFKVDNIKNAELATAQFQLLQESKNEIDSAGVRQEIEGQSRASSGRDFQLRQQQAMQSIRKLFVNLRAARKRVAEYLLDEILYRHPDVEVRKYDLVIEEAPDTINLMSETFDSLVSLARGGMPVPFEMIIETSPLSPGKKKEFFEKIKMQQ